MKLHAIMSHSNGCEQLLSARHVSPHGEIRMDVTNPCVELQPWLVGLEALFFNDLE